MNNKNKTQAILRKIKLLYFGILYFISGKVPPPQMVYIDPINICNLNCPLCITGNNMSNYPKRIMSYSDYKVIIDRLPFVNHVNLFRSGEPFLNPDLLQMIRYTKEKGKIVSVHTNFNINKEESFFSDLINTNLDYLIISLDGASQETYSKYRIGGDFELVWNNLNKIADIKHRLNKKNPAIIWKFVINKYNEFEISKAKKMAQDAGIEFQTSIMCLGDESPDSCYEDDIKTRMQKWLPLSKQYVYDVPTPLPNPGYDRYCRQLFTALIINPDGGVFPCCFVSKRENIFGNLLNESFNDIWNDEKYKYSRSLFLPLLKKPKKVDTICSSCKNYKKFYPSKNDS